MKSLSREDGGVSGVSSSCGASVGTMSPVAFREGNGNLLQYSCLENPMDGGAWWAAVHGVAQSRTRLKQLSIRNSTAIAQNTWVELLIIIKEVHKPNGTIHCRKCFGEPCLVDFINH